MYLKLVCLLCVSLLVLLVRVPEGQAAVSFTAPAPGGVNVRACDDYATSVLHDPWDMNQSSDINTFIPEWDYRGISSLSFSGGLMHGVVSTGNLWFYLVSPQYSSAIAAGGRYGQDFPIDTTKYHKLAIRLYVSAGDYMQVSWNTGLDFFGDGFVISSAIPVSAGWHEYEVELNGIPTWYAPTLPWNALAATGLRIYLTAPAGANFKVDWIKLYGEANCSGNYTVQYSAAADGSGNRYNLYLDTDNNPLNGYIRQLVNNSAAGGPASVTFNTDALPGDTYYINGYMHFGSGSSTPTVYTSGPLRINQAPLIKVLQPDKRGGQSHHPWNMSSASDIQVTRNLSSAEILPFNEVHGLVGDFFHGVNISGNDDPINYVMFKEINPFPIDTAAYRNLTYRMYLEGAVDVNLGSIVRAYWAGDDDYFGASEDVPVHAGWNEYTVDLAVAERVPGTKPWSGTVTSFRVDAHEFKAVRPYYFDYVELRTDDYANSQFAINYEVNNPDAQPAGGTVSFYYNTTASTSGGTLIDSVTLKNPAQVYLWDTSALPAGKYYVYLVADDGLNSTRRLAGGRLEIKRDWEDSTPPVLFLEAPSANYSFNSWLQLKGYALDNIQVAQVELYLDDELLATAHPSLFNFAARSAYPSWADASNAGFDELVDTSGLAFGQHTLRVDVFDTAGNKTSSSMTVTRSAQASPAVIYDPTPSGTAIPVPQWGSKPVSPRIRSWKLTRRGVLSLTVDRLNASCVATLYSDTRKGLQTDSVLTFTPAAQRVKLSGKKIPLPRQKVYFKVSQDCGANGRQSSGPRNLKAFSGSGTRPYSKVLGAMRGKLKVL